MAKECREMWCKPITPLYNRKDPASNVARRATLQETANLPGSMLLISWTRKKT